MIAVICVMAVLILFHIDYDTYNEGGQYISYLLTPATVSLAVPHREIELLKNNIKAVAAGILSGVLASMVGVYILARAFHLNSQLYVTLLPKSITTAIGMGVSEETWRCGNYYRSSYCHYGCPWKCDFRSCL